MKYILNKTPNTFTEYMNTGDIILDIETSTRFWRTSHILEVNIISIESDQICEICFQSEKESDEYDILIELEKLIAGVDRIITFNGRSFDIPHLKKKYKAYRLKSSLEGIPQTDLMAELKKVDALLPLASHRLKDYHALMYSKEAHSEAWATYEILPMLGLRDFVGGSFEVCGTVPDNGSDSVRFSLSCSLPCRISCSTEYFTVSGDGERAEICAGLDHGNLRMYHTDYENYVFLPIEGYAVHKSLASYIAASRKMPADRDNCFTFISPGQKFLENPDKIRKYLLTVLAYCVS